MNRWFERVRRALLGAPSPLVVFAGEEWGLRRVIAGLRDPDQPLVLLDLRDLDCTDSVAVGNALSEAVRRGLGSALFGLGIDKDYAFAAFESFLPALAPVTVAVTGVELCPDIARRLLRSVGPPNRLVVHSSVVSPIVAGEYHSQLDPATFAVTEEEAQELFAAERDVDEIQRAVKSNGGALVAIERALGLEDLNFPDRYGVGANIGAVMHEGAGGVVDALISRKRWVDAFEFALDHAPTRIAEVLDEAGNAYFEAGEFERFWRFLSDAPTWMLRQENAMYWLFNASMAVNKWRSILPRIDKYLESHEAADLRALRATAEINDHSLDQATRAHDAKRSPETARALAFVQQFRGDHRAATRLYKEAIELAEAEGMPRHVVGAAAGMAQAHNFAGSYERSQHWGAWALQQYHAHELREELLRLTVVAMTAYPRLLTGSVKSARQVLDTVRVSESMLGIPSLEGIISTLGDLAVVEGRLGDAIGFYKMNADAAPPGMYASISNDLVQAYLLGGDVDAALSIAERSSELSDLAPGFQRNIAKLNRGSALAFVDWRVGEALLRESLEGLSARPVGPLNARAALNLARSLVRRSAVDEARTILEQNARYLKELGDTG